MRLPIAKCFLMLAVFSICFLLSLQGQTKYPPGNWKDFEQQSRDASSLFYDNMSNLYISLKLLETNPAAANEALAKSINGFKKVGDSYEGIMKYIDKKQLPQVPQFTINLFARFGLKPPTSQLELIDLNVREIGRFNTSLSSITFGDSADQNRTEILKLNDSIYRVMTVTTLISQLSSGPNK
jgi:hypothetical protein